eukprot:scaffold44253_cov81-Phaeocystis_antarctica.AAC.2
MRSFNLSSWAPGQPYFQTSGWKKVPALGICMKARGPLEQSVTLIPCDPTRPRAWRGKCCCEDEPTVVSA